MNPMITMSTMVEVETVLGTYSGQKLSSGDLKLDGIHRLLDAVGNPQDGLKVVHVAGTSGKTSTSYYLRALLEVTGAKVGLTVSPHMDSVRDRVQVGGGPLSETDFVQYFQEFYAQTGTLKPQPSYFEYMVAFAFWVCKKEHVDYFVVETGIGGRSDSTNVVTRADKVCVLTPIGYDHTDILGDTLTLIASEKAGIIQPGNMVFSAEQPPEVMDVFRTTVREQHAALDIVATEASSATSAPAFLRQNFSLALAAVRYIVGRDGRILPPNPQRLLDTVRIPGRWEFYRIGSKTVIVDGAHNPQKLSSLIEELHRRGDEHLTFVCAFKQAPQPKITECIQLIERASRRVVYTTFIIRQDLHTRGCEENELTAAAGHAVEYIEDQQRAVMAALEGNSPVVVVTGSLYLVSQVRLYIQQLSS